MGYCTYLYLFLTRGHIWKLYLEAITMKLFGLSCFIQASWGKYCWKGFEPPTRRGKKGKLSQNKQMLHVTVKDPMIFFGGMFN